jgi:PAS domain S-box-containing protein
MTQAPPDEATQRLAIVESASHEAIVGEDLAGLVTSWNPAAERMFGYPRDHMLGRSLEAIVPADRMQEERARRDRVASGMAVDAFDTRRIGKAGRMIDVAVVSAPVRDAKGDVIGAVTVMRDLSSQNQLERTKAVLVDAQELARLGIWEWDLVTGEATWSDSLYRIFGLAPRSIQPSAEALGRFIHPDERAALRSRLGRARHAGTPIAWEHRIVRADGAVRTVSANARAIVDAAGVPQRLIGTVEDITERKDMIASLVFSDRMVSVGTLAAGVAHEINNPLAYISANLDTVVHALPTGEDLHAMIEEAREGVERIRRIVRGLMTFSRSDEDERAPLDIERVLELALELTNGELRHRARVVRDYGGPPPVTANEARLGQVFINLLVNAAEAIPEGQADRNEIRVVTRSDGAGWARVEIHDTGAGMAHDVAGRIFDPFFTTKPVGSGIGLGLSICHGIVRSLGGEITVETRPGQGSVFHVALPPATEPIAKPPATPPTVASTRRGRVLIVDDEVIFANSLRRMLRHDHEVSVVNSGRAALEAIRSGARFDVVLCDLMMPEITGMDVYLQLLQSAPDQAERVIFMTGGAFGPSARQFLDRIANRWFEKPCDLDELRAAIRQRVG